jgi:ElaB/YqjD/DUF883 family membrane-anchored ribosome-binding protein
MRYDTTEGQSGGATDALKEQAGQVTEKAKEVTGTVQDRVREQVDSRSTQAGEQVGSVSEAMRNMGDQLRDQGNDLPAQLAHQVADRVEQLGQYLREADADRIVRDVEDFGRRQPWVIAAAGLAAGVAAARFIKASGRRRYESSFGGSERSLPSPTYGSTAYGTPAPTTGETWSSGSSLGPEETVGAGGTYPLRGNE